MKNPLSSIDRVSDAIFGMFIGDALAMPVHWYYDTQALQEDYGKVSDYLDPRYPHPDAILWRSTYTPPKKSCDILHDQGQYWGKRDIHYHQFLRAGENTLNIQLARELLLLLQRDGNYLADSWLDCLIAFSQYSQHAIEISLQNLALTHGGPTMKKWGALLATTLLGLLQGKSLHHALVAGNWAFPLD